MRAGTVVEGDGDEDEEEDWEGERAKEQGGCVFVCVSGWFVCVVCKNA